MLTGTLRSQIDQIWNAFWSGGVSNPLSVIEQITYLLFINRLDDLHTLEGNKARTLGKAMERRIFPEGEDPKGRPYKDLRWSRFKNFDARVMMEVGPHDHKFCGILEFGKLCYPLMPRIEEAGAHAGFYSHIAGGSRVAEDCR